MMSENTQAEWTRHVRAYDELEDTLLQKTKMLAFLVLMSRAVEFGIWTKRKMRRFVKEVALHNRGRLTPEVFKEILTQPAGNLEKMVEDAIFRDRRRLVFSCPDGEY